MGLLLVIVMGTMADSPGVLGTLLCKRSTSRMNSGMFLASEYSEQNVWISGC